MDQNTQTNQIIKVQTDKKLIAFYDKLKLAPVQYYAQIHAKGEKIDGNNQHSLIGVTIQDYSNGTGKNTVFASFNLAQEQIGFFLSKLVAGFQDFEWSSEKIYGSPDQQGYSTAQKFYISKHAFGKDGNPQNYPWLVSISNGRGIRMQNRTGGFYMKGGSYQEQRAAYIRLSDMDMYTLLDRTTAFIKEWEAIYGRDLIIIGRKAYAEEMKKVNRANQANSGQYGQQYGSYDQGQYSQSYDQYGNTGGAAGQGTGGHDQYGAYAQQPYNQAPYNNAQASGSSYQEADWSGNNQYQVGGYQPQPQQP